MNFIQTSTLDPVQQNEIRQLEQFYQSKEKGRLTFPLEGGCFYALLYEDSRLVSVMSLTTFEEPLYECMAYTHPDYRQRGYFNQLLDLVLDYLENLEQSTNRETDLYFVTDNTSEDTGKALSALEASYWYSEYQMGRDLSSLPFEEENCSFEFHSHHSCTEISMDKRQVGSFCTSCLSPGHVYFYGFEIDEKERGKGYGTAAFLAILKKLRTEGTHKLSLQVSEQNERALWIYKKAGFQILETLSYYWY